MNPVVNPFMLPEHQYGTTLESLLERRERAARNEGGNYGVSRLFLDLVNRILSELSDKDAILEVDAGSGLLTRYMVNYVAAVTAIEPVPLLYRKLSEINSDKLTAYCGFVEELFASPSPKKKVPEHVQSARAILGFDATAAGMAARGWESGANDLNSALLKAAVEGNEPVYDFAVVSFPARRGKGILALVCELLPLVKDRIFLILPDDGSLDWSSVLRTVSLKGYKARAEFVVDNSAIEEAQKAGQVDVGKIKRVMLLTIHAKPVIEKPLQPSQVINAWGTALRVIEVPYPTPRGAATRLVRYFKSGGDRSILIKTEQEGMRHLYGNMRTAAHRIARDQVTVRRVDEGIQLMHVPTNEPPKDNSPAAGKD